MSNLVISDSFMEEISENMRCNISIASQYKNLRIQKWPNISDKYQFVATLIDLELMNDEQILNLCNEIKLLRKIQTRGIARYNLSFIRENLLFQIHDKYSSVSLKNFMNENAVNGLNIIGTAWILKSLLKVLAYLSQNGIVHRFIMCENIMINEYGCIKLTNFMHAKQIYDLYKQYNYPYNWQLYDYPLHMESYYNWAAPEILSQSSYGYNTSSDLFSLGIAALEMHLNKNPFCDLNIIQSYFEKFDLLVSIDGKNSFFEDIFGSKDFMQESKSLRSPFCCFAKKKKISTKNVIKKLLNPNPRLRPTPEKLLETPFFKNLKPPLNLTDFYI